jgi:hypothetical protein
VAKKARSDAGSTQGRNGAGGGQGQGESVAGYFRKVFAENPRLLKQRSNEELFRRWLADHPGYNEVPQQVKTGLQNIKSVLRGQQGKKKQKKAGKGSPDAGQPKAEAVQRAPRRAPSTRLEALEEQIDECMALARNLDREGLRGVISQLRDARNEVVRKLGGG